MHMDGIHIATIIFAYNRPNHVKKVIESLKGNTLMPQKLFLFQDGPNEQTNMDDWNRTKAVIEGVDWCEAEVIVSKVNRGLADAVVNGINYALETYEAVIVLEDDCVAHPQFMEYMVNSLRKYKDDTDVWFINGYSWGADVTPNGTDAYFAGRSGSWGWGTWKDRWKEYKQDYKMLTRIKKDPYANRQFQIWGRDLECYLHGNVSGSCNSWAVFKSLLAIEKHGYCLTPYLSFIHNIGFDGSGVHCGTEERKTKWRDDKDRSEIVLPDTVEFPDNYEEAYRDIFAWTSNEVKNWCYLDIMCKWMKLKMESKSIADYLARHYISSVSIWGTGRISELLVQELEGKITIASIVESVPKTERWKGIPVERGNQITGKTQIIIVIPVYDMENIREKIRNDIQLLGLDELLDNMIKED